MEAKFTDAVKDIIQLSRKEALKNKNDFIGSEHLMLALLDNQEEINEGKKTAANLILEKIHVDFYKLKDALIDSLKRYKKVNVAELGSIPLTKDSEKILKETYLEAKRYDSSVISSFHLLLSCLKEGSSNAAIVLKNFNIDYDVVKKAATESLLKEIELVEKVSSKEKISEEKVTSEEKLVIQRKAIEEANVRARQTLSNRMKDVDFVTPLDNTTPLSLYFDTKEYSNEDIVSIISLLSELYSNIGGDYLKITGMNQFERIVNLDLA
jgi:ATP-dependent Clp protease ATP-binding subunit ClpA